MSAGVRARGRVGGRLRAAISRSRWLAATVGVALIVSMVGGQAGTAAPSRWQPPEPRDVAGVPVRDYTPSAHSESSAPVVRGARPVSWPAAGTATVDISPVATRPDAPREAGLRRVGSLPVWVGHPARPATGDPGRAVTVTVQNRGATAKAGVAGVLLTLARSGGGSSSDRIPVTVDYSGFAHAYGGDWSSRLRLVVRPMCALTTPRLAHCQTATPLPTRNDATASTVSADVAVAGQAVLLGVEGSPSGDNGDHTATSLSPAGTWQVSNQTGAFSWSYDLRMPPSLGGPAPTVSLSYSAASVDGRTATTNNQGGWIGDGWDAWPGYIERSYGSCADDNTADPTGDQCWFSDNATLSLGGHAGELIQSGNVWRLKNDDGTRVERLTDVGRGNGDNDNEYWVATTTDGVKYFFGYHKLPNYTSGAVTNSTWTVPVYGDDTGEPCRDVTYCTQAWRWNLDYVVDPHDNTMAYFYVKETGAYGRHNTPSQRTTYDRGGYLERVEYGMRAGQEYAQAAPLRAVFDTSERCLSGCWTGAAWTSNPVASAWTDTPWDQYCTAAPCTNQLAPTFWSARRLGKVTTQVRSGAGYRDVESWTLRHEFLNAGTNEGAPMWLRGITRSGRVTAGGATVVTDPEITFSPGSDPLPNRVDGHVDGRTALNRWRIKTIHTESGGDIQVTYSGPDCTRTTLPVPESNTKRCMPAYYAPIGEPTLDWFHKYVVTRVDLDDTVTDQPNQSTFYDYLDTPAWHYNTDEITKDKFRTWGQWRGYGRVQVRSGDPTNTPQTAVEYRYLRGMDGDRLNASGGAKDVWVTDTWGGSIEDKEPLQGFVRQQITFNGPGGGEVSSSWNQPWLNGPTATRTRNGVTTEAWKTNTETSRTRTALAAGGYRISATTTAFNADGLPTTVDNIGDEATGDDNTCTRTTYARNDTTWLISLPSRTETVAGTCATASTPITVLSRQRSFYDTYVNESSFGQAPTRGDLVRTEVLDSFNGSTPVYVRTSTSTFDANGRIATATDAAGSTTTTTNTASDGGLVTQTTVTNQLGHTVTSLKEPAWNLPTRVTDANGAVTELAYDGMGRLTGVWLPGRAKATQTPSTRFTYLVRASGGPSAVTTESLLHTGNTYKKSINLYDGFLRQRQSQTQATGGGRVLTDTFHNTRGNVEWESQPYYDSTAAAPSEQLGVPAGAIPSVTVTSYDGAGRTTASTFEAFGQPKWSTTTSYGGDRISTTPPEGGTATTALTNVFDATVQLRQYHDRADVGSDQASTFDATTYTYDRSGHLTKVVDPAGNQWTYGFDLRGNLRTAVDPDKGTITSTYDSSGRVQTTTSPLGTGTATIAYTYDALGRKITVRDNTPTGAIRAQWVYDTAPGGIGKLAKSIRKYPGADYESRVDGYDSAGRPSSTTISIPTTEGSLCAAATPNTCAYTTTVTYRANGAMFRTTLPAVADLPTETLTYGYNDIGESGNLLSPIQMYVFASTYNKIGQLTQRTLGSSGRLVAVTSTFDEPTRRLSTMNVVPELQPEAADFSYDYTKAGTVTKIADSPAGQTPDTQCFDYDHRQRLTNAWTPSSGDCDTVPAGTGLGGPAPYWHGWEYTGPAGAAGSRTKETRHAAAGDTTFTYAYPGQGATAVRPHTITQIQMSSPRQSWTRGFSYDNAGNLTGRTSNAGNQQTLNWDAEGHLATVVEAGQTTRYIYDADGNRLITHNADGSKVLYLPNGNEVKLAAGASTATGTRYYSRDGATLAVRTAAGLNWIIGDHQGTAQLTIDSVTLAVSRGRTLPFGAERGTPPSGWPTGLDKGFVGGTKDPTGLTHLGARDYDPAIGAFVSVDPVIDPADPQQLHPYAYAQHNPVTRSDPTGQWPSFLAKAANAVTSAASSVGNATANFVSNTVQSIKEDPLKFATGLAVGIACTIAVAAVCSTGIGCVILAGAIAGAAAAGAEYGVDVAQGEREFSVADLATEMAVGGAVGAVGGGAGIVGGKLLSGARGALGLGGKAADEAVDLAADAADAGRRTAVPADSCPLSFDPATPVLLAGGATKAIGRIQIGDQVIASDPISGITTAEPVTALYTSLDLYLADITVANPDGSSSVVHTTQNHPFWNATTQTWTDAGDLLPGDRLRTPDGVQVEVTTVFAWTEPKLMHNLGVSDLHTYYVIAGGVPVLVHNRPELAEEGHWNYILKREGTPYYSGTAGPGATEKDVIRRHTNNTDKKTGINRGRFTPGIDDFERIPGERTYGEARLLEHRLATKYGTIIGRDGWNWLGNRERPIDPKNMQRYLDYEKGLGGGC